MPAPEPARTSMKEAPARSGHRHALRDDRRRGGRRDVDPCTFGSVGPPNFQAAITRAVSSTIAMTAMTTSRDSRCWRWRRLWVGTRRVRKRLLLLARDEPRVVLVDVQLAVHAERVRVGAEEALDVGVARELVELLVLEGAQVLGPHLGAELHLVEIEALTRASLAKA